MIIIGYPGIGKSTLAGRYRYYIDLESSHFNDAFGVKPDGWFIPYCKVAEDLSKQGYRVFVSCHREVQEYLHDCSNEYVLILYPDIELKKKWLDRVTQRYNSDPTMKNKKAMENVEKYWDMQINSLSNSPFEHKLILEDMNYTLDNEIDNFMLKEYVYNETIR
jgi:hypothetical protein